MEEFARMDAGELHVLYLWRKECSAVSPVVLLTKALASFARRYRHDFN